MDKHRRIVVTGVSRGLGLAMAEGFIEQGHTVFGCARSAEAVESLSHRFGSPHRFHIVDVSSDEQVKAWAEEIHGEGGAVDLLVNSAAAMNANNLLWEVPQEDFDRVVDVNIKGVANAIRHFVPKMVERSRGIVVNFSSGWGRSTSPEVAPYCATKWAIEGLTQALAQELPRGMAAVPLNPGIINTDMLQSCFGEGADAYPTPDRWAERAVPFILNLSPPDNGQPLTVG